MKLTNAQLKRIIKEELRSVLKEHWQRSLRSDLGRMDRQIGKHELSVQGIMDEIMRMHDDLNPEWPKPQLAMNSQTGKLDGGWMLTWPPMAFEAIKSILKNKASDWKDTNEKSENYGGDLWHFWYSSKESPWDKPFGAIEPWHLA